jgi:hypothetical protein
MCDEMIEDEMIEVLYNYSYGRFGVSDEAIQLYSERTGKIYDDDNYYYNYDIEIRSDPVLIEIYKQLGNKFNESYCECNIKKIPKKFKKCYFFTDYEGIEDVHIDGTKYDKIVQHNVNILKQSAKEILDCDNMDRRDKLDELANLISSFNVSKPIR